MATPCRFDSGPGHHSLSLFIKLAPKDHKEFKALLMQGFFVSIADKDSVILKSGSLIRGA